MAEKLGFALVGCGRISKRHAELLGNNQVAGGYLKSVCDVNYDKAKMVGEKFDIPYFSDYHEMMLKSCPDVVVVLTESGLHSKHVIDLAPYKKHIVVEKPMALKLSDADKMIENCDKCGVKLFVIKQNRFNVPIQKLREAIENERFGKIVLGTVRVRWCRTQDYYDQAKWRGTWALDGGVLSNQASHHIDMLQWMLGDVESVQAMSATQLVSIEAEDTAIANLKFTSGALGIIEATTAARPKDIEGSISVLGENGIVEIGGFAMNQIKIWQFKDERPEDDQIISNYSVNPPNVYGFGHSAYYDHVVSSILSNGPNLIDGLAGRKSLELINAIYESIELEKKVYLRFKPNFSKLGAKKNG